MKTKKDMIRLLVACSRVSDGGRCPMEGTPACCPECTTLETLAWVLGENSDKLRDLVDSMKPAKPKHDYDYYICEALKAEKRSSMMWQLVNRQIRLVLETERLARTPLSDVPEKLLAWAGRKKRGEAVSIGNMRTAARQIANDEPLVLL